MRLPVSWLREYVDAPTDPAELERALVRVGLEVEEIVDLGSAVTGSLVVGRVSAVEELTGFKKPIRYCLVDVGRANGTGAPQEIVCGARNFGEGDLVVVILPGGELPGGFGIGERRTYGRMSRGMICSGRELGISDDHDGIMVLPPGAGEPGADARGLVGLDEVVVEVNVTPDRGYCFSVRGIARELAASLGLPFRDPAAAAALTGTPTPAYPARVADPSACDRFAAVAVRGLDPAAPSPAWLARRLTQAGMRPICLPVDVTNYVMLELGQPMHAFDLAALRGGLVIRRADPGEKLTTLDGAVRGLHPEDVVIADDSGVVSLAAVMGGASTEVSGTTTDLLLEAAHWDPVTVARTARRHKLPSEASRRYERGVDPTLPGVALRRAGELLAAHGGGAVGADVLDIDTVPPREPVLLPVDLPARTTGVPYPADRVRALLTLVGCAVAPAAGPESGPDARWEVLPPAWRPDLRDPADLVEEVARLDGYDRIPSVLPIAPPGRGLTDAQRRRRDVARALAEGGASETLSFPFLDPGVWDALGVPADDPRRAMLRLANPMSDVAPALRTRLLPGLLAAVRRNVGRGHRDVALYELGLVFGPPPAAGVPPPLRVDDRPAAADLAAADRFLPAQPQHVAVVLAGDVAPAGWWGAGRPASWADAAAAARTVLAAAGVPAARTALRQAEFAPWHPGRCAEVLVDGEVVGHAGELHPAACAALEVPARTCAAELNLDRLPLPGVVLAPRLSGFPPALIDVALVVAEETPAGAVHAALTAGAGKLLESIRLFDVYRGDAQLGAGRKSLAYKLTFRAADRTLTAEEAVAARDAAVAEAAARTGATLRGA
ncbi:phenylalanine--tRNA ligase beta subunit [Pilimelia terevasa]|uniref:Phenylalanine--tRNA ligase beta subunit n=1 Tax=Pilimelia terevasa TaxID=53372 RepID=A0A8J3FH75_9ACTN|nr:phenylalanine--tRNA ligase subunit beta [Pilimelia terevasa]GGK25009.1 phenylalanine--tRNA ligase beta subunit [Pilimelia terevasa]